VAAIDRWAKLGEKCKVAAEARTKHFAQHFPRSHTQAQPNSLAIWPYSYIIVFQLLRNPQTNCIYNAAASSWLAGPFPATPKRPAPKK